METKETVVQLANDFEFTVDTLNVNYNPADKTKSLTFIKNFKDAMIKEVENQLTPENMRFITVMKNGKKIYELEDYTEIISADVNIDSDNQVFTVRAVIPTTTVSGGDSVE